MDARRKEIEHLEGEIKRLEAQITQECVEIGRRVAGADRSRVRNDELLKYLNSSDTLKRSIEGFRADIDRIRGLVRLVDARGQEIDENNRRKDQLLRERQSRFIELGAGAFSVFKGLPDREAYRPMFEEVLKLDLDLTRRHDELRQLEADEAAKGFFEKLKGKAKKIMLRGEISRLDREKTAAYDHAGGRIADTDFARHAEGPLRQLFDALGERKLAADRLAAENDRRVEEIEACRAELKRLEVHDRPEEKAREIELRIQALIKELDVMHCWAGQLYLERDLRAEISDEALGAKYEIVAGLRESIRKKRQQADRLKAEIEVEEIQRKERDRRGRRRQLEEEMRVKERQIAVLDIEINLGLKRIEELKRVLTGEAPYVDAPPLPPTPNLYPSSDVSPPKP
jgi:hypothetical protein